MSDRGEQGEGAQHRAGGDRQPGGDSGASAATSRWEWLTAAIGLLLVVCAIAFLTYEAVAGDRTPPAIKVTVDSIVSVPGGHLVRFRARNEGDETGATVVVEGRLSGAGGEEETSQTTLDYVPGRSERRGGLYFEGDPRAGRLELRALGYSTP